MIVGTACRGLIVDAAGRGLVIGTAGHIDHGKTSLVRALTGIDTDRLPEEKARGITLDLGFAYVPLDTGGTLGFVDVPGHERLVHTMIAGATSIGMALLVVAADDGVMPQTSEHLHVLSLLGINRGAVALTKTDLVDADRVLDVALAVDELLAGSSLAGAEVFPVSSQTGDGIDALLSALLAAAAAHQAAPDDGQRFRLSVDRCFSLAGAGTVVTGSVASGVVRTGDSVVVLPSGQRARVRGIHAANQVVTQAMAGDRCALNLAGPGLRKDAIGRGDWVVDPDGARTTRRCDVRLTLLDDRVRSGASVLVHHGAGQAAGRLIRLDGQGASALVQLTLDRDLPMRVGDRVVLRDVGASRTIAGGRVLDPDPPVRHRRRPDRLADLHALESDQPWSDWLTAMRLVERDAAIGRFGLATIPAGTIQVGDCVATEAGLAALTDAVTQVVARFHADQPTLPGMTAETVRLALPRRLPRPVIAELLPYLAGRGVIAAEGHLVRLPTHRGALAGPEARWWDQVRPKLEHAGNRPPLLRELATTIDAPDVALRRSCKGFARLGLLVEMAPDRFFLRDTAAGLAGTAHALSRETDGGWFTASQFRDRAGCGRQLAIQVLDYLDRRGVTVRRGDLRRAGKNFGP